jgi:DNA primase
MIMQHEHYDTSRLNAISIVEVAQRLGEIRRAGAVYKTRCPWHEDKRPSLTLYERTDENRCHCFACGKGGSVIDYVM